MENNSNTSNNSTNTNNTQQQRNEDVYTNITFNDITDKLLDDKIIAEVEYYHNDADFEEKEKKEVIEICFSREKENCDELKKEIKNKGQQITEKEEELNKRKNELPGLIDKKQEEIMDKAKECTVLQNIMSNVPIGSDKYCEIESKINEIQTSISEKESEKTNLKQEYDGFESNFTKLNQEKSEFAKTVELYDKRVGMINNEIDSISYIDVKSRPQLYDEEIVIENTNMQNMIQNYNEPVITPNPNEAEKKEKDEAEKKENNALIDPNKENKFKLFFSKVKDKIKRVTQRITGNAIVDEKAYNETNEYIDKLSKVGKVFSDKTQEEKFIESLDGEKENEYIDELSKVGKVFSDKTQEEQFIESLKQHVNFEVEEQVEQMERESRIVQKTEKSRGVYEPAIS